MTENSYTCCFTGYRPEKFPFKLESSDPKYSEFENALFEQVLSLAEENCQSFYCGMAMGFDLIAAETVLAVKNAFPKPLKLICVLPFEGQGIGFPYPWGRRFQNVLQNADSVVVLSKKYSTGCYQKRNIYMVDNSDFVVTWFDGRSGGTQNTLRYARKKGRQIFNIYENPQGLGIQTEFEIN